MIRADGCLVKRKLKCELEILVIAVLTRDLVRFHNPFRLTRLPQTCLVQSIQKDKGQNHSRLAGQPHVSLSVAILAALMWMTPHMPSKS